MLSQFLSPAQIGAPAKTAAVLFGYRRWNSATVAIAPVLSPMVTCERDPFVKPNGEPARCRRLLSDSALAYSRREIDTSSRLLIAETDVESSSIARCAAASALARSACVPLRK